MKNRHLFSLVVGCLALLSLVFLALGNQPEVHQLRTVVRVIDGDTVYITGNRAGEDATFPVRLLGVDAPELEFDDKERTTKRECFALESKMALEVLVLHKEINLLTDSESDEIDQYGRLLRYLILPDGTNVNLALVELGAARHLSYFPLEMKDVFEQAEQEARETGRGLWGTCY